MKIVNYENSDSLVNKLRRKRFELFLQTLNISKTDTIIDIGGYEGIWEGTGLESQVTLLNLTFGENKPNMKYIEGNACDMHMIEDQAFDVAFSNSVIEHVGKNNEQELFAKEVQRIAKKYWIQTPYKHFPIEPHLLFPLFQYFPSGLQSFIGKRWPYSHLKKYNLDIPDELARLKLLTKSRLKGLFNDGKLHQEKYAGWTKSIIAYKK